MRESRRHHDDTHRPFGGRGARALHGAPTTGARLVPIATPSICESCGWGDDTLAHRWVCGLELRPVWLLDDHVGTLETGQP